MKTAYKFTRVVSSALAISIVFGAVSAPVSRAIAPGENAERMTCSNLTVRQTAHLASIDTKISAMQTDFAARLAAIGVKQESVDLKAADFRSNRVKKLNDKIATFESNHTLTDAQKDAVNTYKNNVLAAEQTRQQAVDAARQTYRTTLRSAITERQDALTAATSKFRSSVNAAFTNAISACDGSGAAVQQTLRSEIKTARQTLKSDRTEAKVGETIRQAAATRRADIQAADKTFRQSVAEFSKTLALALKSK